MLKNTCIVLFTYANWDTVCDFERQTAEHLSKNNKVIVFNCQPPNSLLRTFTSITSIQHLCTSLSSLFSNLTRFPAYLLLPGDRFRWIKQLNQYFVMQLISIYINILAKKGKHKLIFWTFYPETTSILKKLQTKRRPQYVMYDCVDYFTPTLPSTKRQHNVETELISRVDAICCNSKSLYALKKSLHPNVHLVPQGCNTDVFLRTKQRSSVPSDMELISHPIVGFIGTIEYRLDLDLLISLAKQTPDISYVFVGPRGKNSSRDKNAHFRTRFKVLTNYPNVFYIHAKAKQLLPHYIDAFDIGMVPYDISDPFNKYCYPMKVFEYFARCKPVISTPIEELKHFPKFVKIGKTAKGWEQHIKTLLAKPWPQEYQQEQRKLAEANSWEKKIEAISQVIEKKLHKQTLT